MQTNDPARVFFLLAREANKAVVFRRGPTKWTQMIVWDLSSDELEYGQWSKVKFQKWRSDLSPSGKYLIYMDDQIKNDRDSSTIISKPPYWNALVKWTNQYPSSGSGIFKSEDTVLLNGHYKLQNHRLFPPPVQLKVHKKVFDVEVTRLERDGWSLLDSKAFVDNETNHLPKKSTFWNDIHMENEFQSSPHLWSKPITKNSFLYRLSYFHPKKFKRLNKFFVKRKYEVKELEKIEWAEVDHHARIIATKDGTLLASKVLNNGTLQLDNLELLYDLTPQKPIKISVPDKMKKW